MAEIAHEESMPEGWETGSGLRRRLSVKETAALTFANCGITAGIFGLFGFALSASGPAFFWGWLLIVIAVGFMTLMWAEFSSHYPHAGAMYHWVALTVGRRVGWWVGWMYLIAQIAILTAYYFVLPQAVIPLFGLPYTLHWQVGIALGALAVATLFNALGIELLGKVSLVGVAAELFILGGIGTLVLAFGATQPVSVVNNTEGMAFGTWLTPFLAAGLFMSIWTIFGFEAAGQIGDETLDAHWAAPRAIMLSFLGSFLLGTYFILSFIIGIPNLSATEKSSQPLIDIINNALPNWFGKLFLALMAGVVILGANAYFTNTSRQLYGMGRSDQLPWSHILCKTRNGTPWIAVLSVAVITGLPYFVATEFPVLVAGATALIYVVYSLAMILFVVARLRGWPGDRKAPFRLGRWGLPLNLLAVVGTVAITVNLLWPRDATNPVWHWGIRSAYWMVGIPIVVGVFYYVFVQHGKIARTERATHSATETLTSTIEMPETS